GSKIHTTNIPMLCVTIFVILVVWFLLPRVARLMIHTPTAISIFVCLSMVQLMAVFISMRCTLCGHFLQVALTLILVVGYAIRSGSKIHTTNIPMLCVTIFVILVVWFLLPRVARLMIHTPTAISIFVCLSMVQLMAVFISMRCTLCGHFLQVALTLILVVGYAI